VVDVSNAIDALSEKRLVLPKELHFYPSFPMGKFADDVWVKRNEVLVSTNQNIGFEPRVGQMSLCLKMGATDFGQRVDRGDGEGLVLFIDGVQRYVAELFDGQTDLGTGSSNGRRASSQAIDVCGCALLDSLDDSGGREKVEDVREVGKDSQQRDRHQDDCGGRHRGWVDGSEKTRVDPHHEDAGQNECGHDHDVDGVSHKHLGDSRRVPVGSQLDDDRDHGNGDAEYSDGDFAEAVQCVDGSGRGGERQWTGVWNFVQVDKPENCIQPCGNQQEHRKSTQGVLNGFVGSFCVGHLKSRLQFLTNIRQRIPSRTGYATGMRTIVAIAALSMGAPSWAQDGFDAHGFKLAAFEADPRDPLTMERPDGFEQGDWYAGSLLEYARAPLIRRDSLTGDRQAILDHIVAMNLSGGIAAHEYVRFGVSWPLYLTSTGGDLTSSGTSGQGVGVGDMRLNAMGTYQIPATDGEWGIGLAPHLDLPLGKATEFLGQGSVAGGLTGSGTRELGSATVGANLGLQFNPTVDVLNATNADGFLLGLHGGWLLDEVTGVNFEFKTLFAMASNDFRGSGSPGEAIVSFRHQPTEGPQWVGGLAAALTPGVGAAAFRLMAGGNWGAKVEGSVDSDADGLVDSKDQCPDEAETVNNYLEADGCPDELPGLSVTVVYQGEVVPDAALLVMTGDVIEEVDFTGVPVARQDRPGVEWAFEASSGPCLAGRASVVTADGQTPVEVVLEPNFDQMLQIQVMDADGEPIEGAQVSHSVSDAGCASTEVITTNESGKTSRYVGPSSHTVTASAEGYEDQQAVVNVTADEDEAFAYLIMNRVIEGDPVEGTDSVRVRIEPTRIAILEPIHFDTGRTTIQSVSHQLLDDLAQTIRNAPEIGDVTIAGHTDSEGSEDGNQRLSTGRAEAVLDYLVNAGVNGGRLKAVGYGETKPIAPNRTEAGRAKNRRVEFELGGE